MSPRNLLRRFLSSQCRRSGPASVPTRAQVPRPPLPARRLRLCGRRPLGWLQVALRPAGGAPPLAAPCGCRGPLARRSPALPPASAARLVLSSRCAAVALTCTRAVWAGTGGGAHARVQTPLGLVVGGGCEAGRLGHLGSPPLRTAARACPRGLARRVAHAAASWRQIRTSVQKAGEHAARGRRRGSSCLRLGRTDRPTGLGAPICYHMTGVSKFQLPARVLISI